MKNLIFIFITLITVSCSKEILKVDNTDLLIEYKTDIFNDSIYDITKLEVTSTNDSVINFSKIRISDADGVIFFDNEWRQLQNNSFALPLRKEYELEFKLYRNINDTEIIDATFSATIDNHKYPKKIQLISAEVESSILESQDISGINAIISSSYQVLITSTISNIIEDDDEIPSNSDLFSYDFYEKYHTPKKINFTFNNLYFDTKKIHDNQQKWMHYRLTFSYPLEAPLSGGFLQYRSISFFINVKDKIASGETAQNVEYIISNDINSTSGGGTSEYKGKLKIKWIYEN